MNQHPIRVLLIEDDPEDILIIQMVLNKAKGPNELFVVQDGQAALDFLYHRENIPVIMGLRGRNSSSWGSTCLKSKA